MPRPPPHRGGLFFAFTLTLDTTVRFASAAERIGRWFAPEARVTPGPGGAIAYARAVAAVTHELALRALWTLPPRGFLGESAEHDTRGALRLDPHTLRARITPLIEAAVV